MEGGSCVLLWRSEKLVKVLLDVRSYPHRPSLEAVLDHLDEGIGDFCKQRNTYYTKTSSPPTATLTVVA